MPPSPPPATVSLSYAVCKQFLFSSFVYLFSPDLGLTTVALINIILVKSPRVKENSPNLHVEAVCLPPPLRSRLWPRDRMEIEDSYGQHITYINNHRN